MKRIDLIRLLTEDHSVVFVRNGGSHDIYRNVVTNKAEAVPRHREIKKWMANKIIESLSNPEA